MFRRYWWMLLAMVPVGMMAGCVIAAVISYIMPRQYQSRATIEIKPPPVSAVSAGSIPASPNHFPTELAKIRTRNTLMEVVVNLGLHEQWDTDVESALELLKGIVHVENIRGTDLCSIRVVHADKVLARDIAGEVVRAYKRQRAKLAEDESDERISRLKKAVREQEDRVEEHRKILTMIATSKGAEGGSDPVDAQGYADAKREFETAMSLLEQLKLKLIGEEIDSGLAGGGVVVHDEPVIEHAPVSPNVNRNLLIGLAGGVVVSPFLALPLMWILHRRNGRDGLSEPSGTV